MDSPYFLHMQHHSSTMTCLFLRLFKVKILPSVVVQTKKAIHVGALFLQMLFEGKARLAGAKHIIKSFDLECSPFGWEPTNPIPTTLIQLDRVKEIEENGDHLHLQIMHGFDGGNILLTGVIRKQQMVCSLLQTGNTKQHRESFLQGLIFTPYVTPKQNFMPVFYLKSHKSRGITPMPPNIFANCSRFS
jgi:hypothetical protein